MSLLSPKYEAIILLTWCCPIKSPIPQFSRPQSLETKVNLSGLCTPSALSKFIGAPQVPNPPTKIVEPDRMS